MNIEIRNNIKIQMSKIQNKSPKLFVVVVFVLVI